MSRPPRIEFAGAVYHVMARGHERGAIYREDDDRDRFLRELGDVVIEQAFVVHDRSVPRSLGDKRWRRGDDWFSVHEVACVADRGGRIGEDAAALTESLCNPEGCQNLVVARSDSR